MNEYSYFAEAIKRSVKMEDAARFYGLTFNRAGFAVCPFHQEKTASFKVHNGKGHCFGCGWQGSVIDFVMQMFGLDFPGALRKLNSDFGLALPLDRKPTLREQRDAEKKQKELRRQSEERLSKAAYDLEQYNRLSCYQSWLWAQEQTEAVKFDTEYIGRLMEQAVDVQIDYDAQARVEVLLSKHDNADTFKWHWIEENQSFPTYEQFYMAVCDPTILL